MSNKFFQAKAYLSYWLDAVDEHSLHSPFYFDFYTRVVKKNKKGTPLEHAEKLRAQLLKDQRFLTEPDLGSGSSTKRQISRLAQSSLSPVSISSLYSDMADYFKAKKILELGTSFGINALYLASKPERSLTTFEGTADVADIARLTFEFTNTKNIQFIQGNIDVTLKEHLHSVRKLDLILMDANHRYEPTMRYFNMLMTKLHETSVVIVDDIHYSAEMQKAWTELKNHKLVYGSADLFRCGILFFDPSLNKQHVILQV